MARTRLDHTGRVRRARSRKDGVADARVRILDAAEHLIANDGFDATPTSRIAARAKVAKGLLFHYFPRKIDLLRCLLSERLPAPPKRLASGIAERGDMPGSLLRLAQSFTQSQSPAVTTILFREAGTHPEVGQHLEALRDGLVELTETVLDEASPQALDRQRRHGAADTYVAVLLHDANARRFNGPLPDLDAAAHIVAAGLASP
ncbi:TetR/AcrR family transcriptional regulator [Aeromicrobium sp.]|uniref:TetR/AcrR family transcriptional regulator n=1 Tax=Aeromicrobium sp. TaxID=1871063 RepID=UPI002FC941B5